MSAAHKKETGTADKKLEPLPPPRPRPILFKVLCVVFAIWIALLLLDYFTSVFPRRH